MDVKNICNNCGGIVNEDGICPFCGTKYNMIAVPVKEEHTPQQKFENLWNYVDAGKRYLIFFTNKTFRLIEIMYHHTEGIFHKKYSIYYKNLNSDKIHIFTPENVGDLDIIYPEGSDKYDKAKIHVMKADDLMNGSDPFWTEAQIDILIELRDEIPEMEEC